MERHEKLRLCKECEIFKIEQNVWRYRYTVRIDINMKLFNIFDARNSAGVDIRIWEFDDARRIISIVRFLNG